jgi:spore germination protein GerM
LVDGTGEVMMHKQFRGPAVILAISIALILAVAGCGEKGEVTTQPKTVPTVPKTTPAEKVSVNVCFMRGDEAAVVVRKAEKGGAEGALTELLNGPTEGERREGLFSPIPEGTRLNSYTVEDGAARVDFSGELLKFGGGSAAVQGITMEIDKTVLANDLRVSTVEITIDGQPAEEVLQP